jgi:hypothetical protein
MEQHTFEALSREVGEMKRRLNQVLGLFFVLVVGLVISVVLHFSGHTAFAQQVQFAPWGERVYFFRDGSGNTCYALWPSASPSPTMSCVK